MSNRFANLRLLAAIAAGSSLITLACKDSSVVIDSNGGSVGEAGSAGSNAGSGSSGGTGGAAGSGDMGGSSSVGGSGNPGGSGGTGAGTGGSGDLPPDGGILDPDGGSGDGGGLAATFQVLDFAGATTANEIKTVVDWDVREKFTFNVTGNHGASATVEVANSQAALSFGATDPDPLGTTNVFQFVKTPTANAAPDNDWDGWAHMIFGLGGALPEDLVLALPQWDFGTSTLVPGTKVIQLDVYYDDTVDSDFDWDTLIALESSSDYIWNSDAAQGYKIDLQLVNYTNHADFAGSYDGGGYYIAYSAYVPQPNTWVTLTFTVADAGRTGNFGTASSSQVTGIGIKPAPGYEGAGGNSNPVYLRNLKIVDAP